MIADALNVLVAVCDSASILGTDPTFSPAGAGGAATPLVVLSRILVVHCRVLVKGRVRFVRFVYIFVQLWISLTLWGGGEVLARCPCGVARWSDDGRDNPASSRRDGGLDKSGGFGAAMKQQ